MSITKGQIKAVYTAIKSMNLDKEDVVWQYTLGRTGSVSAMTFDEAHSLLSDLNGSRQAVERSRGIGKTSEKANMMRRKILSCCYTMNYPKVNGKLDLNAVNKTIERKGYLNKQGKIRLNDYTVSELPKLVTQFERFRDHYLNKINR